MLFPFSLSSQMIFISILMSLAVFLYVMQGVKVFWTPDVFTVKSFSHAQNQKYYICNQCWRNSLMENEVTAYLIKNQILFIWRQTNIHRQLNRWKRLKSEKAPDTPDFIGCELLFYISAKQFSYLDANWPMGSGCEMHNIGNLVLMSYLLSQTFSPLENHKLALPGGPHTSNPSILQDSKKSASPLWNEI